MSKHGGTSRWTASRRAPSAPGDLLVHYALLALVTAGVVDLRVRLRRQQARPAADRRGLRRLGRPAQRACLGRKIELAQSGRFVTISNAQSTLGGALKFVNGRLSGAVSCVRGRSAQLDAHVSDGVLAGSLGGLPVSAAAQARSARTGGPEAAGPGIRRRRIPAGPELGVPGQQDQARAGGLDRQGRRASKERRGSLIYRAGPSPVPSPASTAGDARWPGTAAGRTLELMLTPLKVATASGGPYVPRIAPTRRGNRHGCGRLPERISATKQRTAEAHGASRSSSRS